ncbi:MAG: hypothetical protein OXQ89_24540, partial [Rhodospirillaceae bacterium]|nr:hypothetical protein [Rhodospirillaceae bacterium]
MRIGGYHREIPQSCILLFVHGLNRVHRGVRTVSLGQFVNGHEATKKMRPRTRFRPQCAEQVPDKQHAPTSEQVRYIRTPGVLEASGSWPFVTPIGVRQLPEKTRFAF